MSFQYKRADIQVVACDLCGDFSWIGDRHWRAMPQSTPEQPIHLCRSCQQLAIWCSAHQQYHRHDAFHRCACVDCGGLFTSVVAQKITRCPACRRSAGAYPPLTPADRAERPRSLIQRLFSFAVTRQ